MPGLPKDPALRQRRNKSVTRAILPAEKRPLARVPKLPAKREWQDMTLEWWRDLWRSPMAGEYLRADQHALFRLAVLVDMFWLEPTRDLAAEIRQQQQAFGLTPLDRRRLEWNIEQAEQAKDKRDKTRSVKAFVISGDDPRDVLK